MTDFQIGDRVKVSDSCHHRNLRGLEGVVERYDPTPQPDGPFYPVDVILDDRVKSVPFRRSELILDP